MASLERPIIDVVIPAHYKDLSTLEYSIKSIRKNIRDVRRIIVVSKEKYTNSAEWFDEALYPFTFKELSQYVEGFSGWHFQQLLKLYAPLVIPGISENVLIVDSDTVFFRKISMFSEDGKPLYNLGKDKDVLSNPFYKRSTKHIVKLLPSLSDDNIPEDFRAISGITHHMLFQRHVIEDLFKKIEANHNQEPFYKLFLKLAEEGHSIAEYSLYFRFILVYYFNQIGFRRLKYKNTADFNLLRYKITKKYHYCSFHAYMRDVAGKEKIWWLKIKNFWQKNFFYATWNIGFADCKIEDFLSKNDIKINWFGNLRPHSFIVDPFGFEWSDGCKYVIYEYMSCKSKAAKIAVAKLNDKKELVEEKLLIDDEIHSSYPFVFWDQNQLYLLAERSKTNQLDLYKFSSPHQITKVKTILQNMMVVDPTIVKYNNIWWLFFVNYNKGDSFLNIAYSDDLLGDWKLHPKNPVKISDKSSRPAGTPFVFEGNLYRPAQNGSKQYGGSVVICKIIKLTEGDFLEEIAKEIFPDKNFPYCHGIHTISSLGNLTLVDGKKVKFFPFKFLFSIRRNLLRALHKIKTKKLGKKLVN